MGTRLATVGSISWERGGHGAGSTNPLHKPGTKINDELKGERDDPSRCPCSSQHRANPRSMASNSCPCCLPEQIPFGFLFFLSCMIPDNFSRRRIPLGPGGSKPQRWSRSSLRLHPRLCLRRLRLSGHFGRDGCAAPPRQTCSRRDPGKRFP